MELFSCLFNAITWTVMRAHFHHGKSIIKFVVSKNMCADNTSTANKWPLPVFSDFDHRLKKKCCFWNRPPVCVTKSLDSKSAAFWLRVKMFALQIEQGPCTRLRGVSRLVGLIWIDSCFTPSGSPSRWRPAVRELLQRLVVDQRRAEQAYELSNHFQKDHQHTDQRRGTQPVTPQSLFTSIDSSCLMLPHVHVVDPMQSNPQIETLPP